MKNKFLIIFIFFNLILNTVLGAENLNNIDSTNYGVYEADNLKQLYGQNTQEKISIASITKLMTAVVAIENINDLNEYVTVDYSLISNNLDPELAVAGIYDGQTLTYYDLLATMLIPSGADSAIYLSEIIFNDSTEFINQMNKKAHKLQMNNTNFSNVTGLDDENNYSTIEDVAKLLKYVLENNTLKEIISLKEYTTTDGKLTVSSTISRSAQRYGIDINYILGGKTGTTGDAGICLASYFNDESVELITVVTGADMYSTEPFNIIDTESLDEYISDTYSMQNIISTGEEILRLNTLNCKQDSVTFYSDTNITKYLDKLDKSKINIEYNGVEILTSNIQEGEKIGEISIYYDNELLKTSDIILNEKLDFSLTKWISNNRYPILITIASILVLSILFYIKFKKKSKNLKSKIKTKNSKK